MKIINYNFDIAREPLIRPFKFKGGEFTEKWITSVFLESESGCSATGIGSLAVLWSDAAVFSAHSETGGNVLMSAVAEYALKLVKGKEYLTPIQAQEDILESLHEYGQKITNNKDLRKTFTLNSLIALDNAMWKIYARENNSKNFDELILPQYREAFSARQEKLVCIPLLTYNVPVGQIKELVRAGRFFLKIKIGQAGTQEEMLDKDKKRLGEIWEVTKTETTEYTRNGKIIYYLDANGRYLKKETLRQLLDYAGHLGMLEQIIVLEEPFPEEVETDVSDLPVRVSADESLHRVNDINKRIDLGYRAMTLKPAGKTLSLCFEMGLAAYKRNVPCYVADSSCIPVLVDWNKNVAARLGTLPELKVGMIESNGAQFYRNWENLLQQHPAHGAQWLRPRNGIFYLDNNFYKTSGGIF